MNVIMTVKREWLHKILAGSKTAEIRKSGPVFAPRTVFFAQSGAPLESAVVARAGVQNIWRGPPQVGLEIYRDRIGMSPDEFLKHYKDKNTAVIWTFHSLHEYPEPRGIWQYADKIPHSWGYTEAKT